MDTADSKLFNSLTAEETLALKNSLQNGENIQWAGHPLKGKIPTRTIDWIAYTIVAGIVIYFVFTFAKLYTIPGNIDLKVKIAMMAFAAPAILFLFYRSEIQRRKHAVYALTDQRAIFLNSLSGRFTSLPYTKLKRQKDILLKPKENNRGTIMFRVPAREILSESSSTRRGKNAPPMMKFERIQNSGTVYDLIQENRVRVNG